MTSKLRVFFFCIFFCDIVLMFVFKKVDITIFVSTYATMESGFILKQQSHS